MVEIGTMALFCMTLFVSVGFGWSIMPAMVGGLVLFLGYGLARGHRLAAMVRRAVASMRAAGMVIGTFVLIAFLTSLWRGSGTIAFIVVHAATVIHPATVLPLSFLLCSGMSVLVGSSFATVATMGTICMSLGLSMGASPAMLGGTILAGIYVGDRWSPVSTSAQLVAQLTHTNLFDNLKRMLRTGAVPFILSLAVYTAMAMAAMMGIAPGSTASAPASHQTTAVAANAQPIDVGAVLGPAFDLHWTTVLPAVLVLALAVFRVDVRAIMLAGIAASAALCMLVQHVDWQGMLRLVVFGYDSPDPQVAALLNGGGVISMLSVMVIVMVSSAYAGIFAETRMLAGLQRSVMTMGKRIGAFAATAITALCSVALSCNQTLAIMLVHQLCGGLYGGASGDKAGAVDADEGDGADRYGKEDESLSGMNPAEDEVGDGDDDASLAAITAARWRSNQAIDMEDTVVVMAPMIPWCIAGAVPLATINAPTASILFATFLYLLPLCRLAGSVMPTRDAFTRNKVVALLNGGDSRVGAVHHGK